MANKTSIKQSPDSGEYHVASLVAHAMTEYLHEIQTLIKSVEGAEVHAVSDEGKIVFTIEGNSHNAIGKKIDAIRGHVGLFNVSPVYHQYVNGSEENTPLFTELKETQHGEDRL